MRKAYGLVGAALASLLWFGCDRGGSDAPQPPPASPHAAPTTTPAPASDPGAAAPAPTTSAAVPAEFLTIDNRMVQFPPALMRLESSSQQEGRSSVLLYSAKPPNRADEEKGNSFYFELDLEIDGFAKIDGATWQYKAPSGDRQESPIGIFLDGMRRQLQPYEVLVEFEGSQPPYTVHLNGYFLSFSARDPNLPPERVFVSGKLEASIDR